VRHIGLLLFALARGRSLATTLDDAATVGSAIE
jgi:hypothetical protein